MHGLEWPTPEVIRLHECCGDGGYPCGLAGEAISSTARGFSVYDVFDALTSARLYKPAWSRRDALAEVIA